MADDQDPEFLSLEPRLYTSEDGTDSSPFDTLWPMNHSRLSPTPTPSPRVTRPRSTVGSPAIPDGSEVDLRALEYVSEYDSNLMCPICHVPFVEPVVLDCDHTFCAWCYEQYRIGGPTADRSKCPSCRSYHLGVARKASRLIKNMCNDIKVRCPNEGCDTDMARGCIELHISKDCPEQELPCPGLLCDKRTKRKNFVPDQCIHTTHVICDCGAVIALGRGEWIRHKDESCPSTHVSCTKCGASMSSKDYLGGKSCEKCSSVMTSEQCPGAELGCDGDTEDLGLEAHVNQCPLARLAPFMKKQSSLLQSLQEQLKMTNLRNEVLENGFERLRDIIENRLEPKIERIYAEHDPDIEEVVRDDIPGADRDLLHLPAHIRELTPSPTSLHLNHNDMISMQDNLRTQMASLEAQIHNLEAHLTDLDARTSMALMNETLRIKEDMAHLNASMFSTKSQVQWLLNRERIASQQAAMGMYRGRPLQTTGQAQDSSATQSNTATGPAAQPQPHAPSLERVLSRAAAAAGVGPSASTTGSTTTSPAFQPMDRRASTSNNHTGLSAAWPADAPVHPGGSGPSSSATSPTFAAARPTIRRSSGGGSSQERVKL